MVQITGSVAALVRWFDPSTKEADEFEREDLLRDVYQASAVATNEDGLLVKTPLGQCMIERVSEFAGYQDVDITRFHHVRDDRMEARTFWYNTSSVEDLMQRLQRVPVVSFEDLFFKGHA